MPVERRAGAMRLIAWTGERCVPWTDNVQVVYEHYHRYLWASTLTSGRRVLDLGSGEGFGSAILADEAASVQGIDVDELSVSHAQLNYRAPNLAFGVGSVLALDAFDDDAFDVVVSFEVLEHVAEQERMLEQIDRVLAPDGVLIVSTPERRMYSEASAQDNPFHERELTEPEFRALLGERFEHVALWGQRTMCGSRLAALDGGAAERPRTFFLERSGDEWRLAGEPSPMYLVALASRVPVELPAAESTLIDHGIQLVREQELRTELARQELTARLTDAEAAHRAELETLSAQTASAVGDAATWHAELAAAQAQLARIDGSVAWSAFQFLRARLYGVIGEHSRLGAALQWGLRRVGRLRASRRSHDGAGAGAVALLRPAPAITFPAFAQPLVSIVIPAHVGAAVTEACLRAIASRTVSPPYEVIVVDDAGDAGNRRLWKLVEGARIIVNEHNLGYLRSVNLGAAQARGRYIVPLNNDTEVQDGWLRALVDRAESSPDIGVVAPKLLYPDGSLQEAGAIIFSDGSGWNFGRGLHADAGEFNYVRDVDYGSGACLLVRAGLWRELGGYSERYEPMYYEDTDLCFAARERGMRVVYEPAARVVHVEGASAGTDLQHGGKRHQELNRPTFVERWRDQLEQEQWPPAAENVRRASDRNRGRHVLVVDHRVPTPDRDSGSLRMTHILRLLVDMGCRVTFVPDDLAGSGPYARELQEIGIAVMGEFANLRLEIAEIGPDVDLAIVSRPLLAPPYFDLVREYAPGATLAYDTVDLHFVREQRRAALAGSDDVKSATLRELELGLMRGADVTITVSEAEREIVAAHLPEARVVVVPNANAVAEAVAPPQGRSGLLFVGGFEHTPNIDAALVLVEEVMPLVWRELGPVALKIVGADPPAEVRELAGEHVEITGWVKDLSSLYASSRVMVAPLQYGAGMKGKVTQSLAAGLPVVTTAIGAEGLDAVDGRDMLIAEDARGLAERIARLVRDDELWLALSQAGLEVAERAVAPAVMRRSLEQLLSVSVGAR